ncbi:hypothetical protein VTI74DRAFT_10086 [Chaetomium olivicolor]
MKWRIPLHSSLQFRISLFLLSLTVLHHVSHSSHHGATGKQDGAVIDALLARGPSDSLLLAVTRNTQSASAKHLAAKSSHIKLVDGDLDTVPALFQFVKKVAGSLPLWGVYSVQVHSSTSRSKAGVQHFVCSSAERGGDESSRSNPTNLPHFKMKHKIEHHLRDATSNGKSTMGWTILRPAIFMDNLAPGFAGKVFLTLLRDTIKEKPLQWVATKDIGSFAAEAFHDPGTWNRKAVGLAGDELTFTQLSQVFQKSQLVARVLLHGTLLFSASEPAAGQYAHGIAALHCTINSPGHYDSSCRSSSSIFTLATTEFASASPSAMYQHSACGAQSPSEQGPRSKTATTPETQRGHTLIKGKVKLLNIESKPPGVYF